jgi:hypothetical protein
MEIVSPVFFIALAGAIIFIFFIFLSSGFPQKPIRIFLMFFFTMLASIFVSVGLNGAYQEAKNNLGRPSPVLQEGKEYAVYWGVFDPINKKIYLVAKDKEEAESLPPRFYELSPSNKFLQEFLRQLRKKEPFKIRIEGGEEGLLEEITIHPDPPPSLPPKDQIPEE